jgi:hypothetical protein
MAVTKTTYTQSGNTTQYNVPFEVIAAADIDVYINGVLQLQQNSTSSAAADHPQVVSGEITQGTALTNYTVASNNATITFNAAPAASAFIIVERTTDSTGLATFVNGSTIRAADLNESFERVLFIAEEGTNVAGEALVASDDEDDAFDAKNDKIINLANGTDDDDAVNRAQLGKVITDDLIGGNGVTLTDASGGANSGKQTTISVPDGTTSVKGLVKLSSTTPITTTYNSAGDVTLSIADDTVDFDKIKNADKIKLADQEGDYDLSGSDDKVFTSVAAIRRFENYVQNSAPSTTGIGKGAVWLDVDDDKTLSVWDGSAWQAVTSGGTFSNQPKVVYVDASSGSDSNDGHRISRPKATIKAAITQINADSTHGDGSIVVVAPGVYQEACPIQIQKRDVAIVGTSVRNCVVHPTPATETATMFEVNSGSYLKNLTFTGMKASGTRGASGSLWENSTHGLPPTQGWNVAFFNNAMIYKSPYVQNCTNFSDSEIDNSNLNFYAGDENKGRAGDLDSAPTGGGLLIDGSTPHADSPLRSIVCDSYTHTGLDAPGIFVTNNGYCQATSSYAFFNHAHITCINGGQANLAASTTDFGRFGLIASGKSTSAIFTSTIDGAVSDGAISFNIDAPTAASGWHGSATRPQSNMLVTVNSVTYPILSATANGSGWTVTISRPNSSNRSQNLGVNGAISDGAAVSFFLRSMIASSGHTMEYVGSGTDYRALPGNGGVPVDANQKVELDNGKIWTATTDQNGKFTIGGNQTDDPFFEVDQQLGFVTIPEGSIAFNLLSDLTPQLGGDLDVNGKKIVSVSNGDIEIEPNGTGNIVLDGKVGVGISSPDGKLTLPATASNTPALRLQSASSNTDGALSSFADASGTYIALGSNYHLNSSGNGAVFDTNDKSAAILFDGRGSGSLQFLTGSTGVASERMRVRSDGRFVVNTTTPRDDFFGSSGLNALVNVEGTDNATRATSFVHNSNDAAQHLFVLGKSRGTAVNAVTVVADDDPLGGVSFQGADGAKLVEAARVEASVDGTPGTDDMPGRITFSTRKDGSSGTLQERIRIDSSGNVGIGATSPGRLLHLKAASSTAYSGGSDTADYNFLKIENTTDNKSAGIFFQIGGNGEAAITATEVTDGATDIAFQNRGGGVRSEKMRLDSSGHLLVGGSTSIRSGNIEVIQAGNDTEINVTESSDGGNGPKLRLTRTRGSNVSSPTAISSGNFMGRIAFDSYDSANYRTGAQIEAMAAADWSSSNCPTDLYFSTTASSNNSPTERMRIDSDGKLLVGLSSSVDSSKVQINFSATLNRGSNATGFGNNIGVLKFADARANSIYGEIRCLADGTPGTDDYPGSLTFSTTANDANTTTERMRITSEGKVGIGTTNPGDQLHIHTASSGAANVRFSSNDVSSGFFVGFDGSERAQIWHTADAPIRFATHNNERMQIDGDGRLLINHTADTAPNGYISKLQLCDTSYPGSS